MAGVPEPVLNWLYSALTSEYADVNRTYHDVAEALSHYPSLSPRTEVYTYENGSPALLLRLGGTLPVTFRDTTYGFPVVIWVPYAYPRESPLIYVTPTQDMLVRPGQHVGGDGRVYHPYLAQWGKYWDKSTIFDFIAVLRGVFAKEPPVRSKQQQQQFSGPPQQGPRSVQPPPAEWQRSTHGAPEGTPSPAPSSQAPAPPPKPPKPYEQNKPTPPPQSQHDRYAQPPPLPAHPPRQHPPPQQQHQQSQRNSHVTQDHWRQPGFPPQNMDPTVPVSQPRPRIHPQRQQPNPHELGSAVSPMTSETQRTASRYQQPAPPPQQSPANIARQQQRPPPNHQQLPPGQPPPLQRWQQTLPQSYPSQHHPHHQVNQRQQPPQHAPPPPQAPIDLLDDSLQVTIPSQKENKQPLPVPPVPPNPEKDALLQALSQTLVQQIHQTVSSNTSAVAPLRAQQSALQTAYMRLRSELGELQQLDSALASNEKILRDTMAEADRVMDDARRRKVPDVDDVLVAPTVVGGQLYNLAAEERGIADALFVLGRALDKGRVGADVFVKQTRSLAREQFLKKALIKKISKGMALDDYQMR